MDAAEQPIAGTVEESGAAAMVAIGDRKLVNQSTEALKDVVFGSAAGMVGKAIEFPFDTVKVRLQSQPDHLPLRYLGPIDCFRKSFRDDGGLRSLYRGISAPLMGAALEASSLFFSYRIAQSLLVSVLYPAPNETAPLPALGISALVACGGASGAFTSFILTPIELIKCQMQVPAAASPAQRPLSIIASTYRHHGILGFWRGQLGTLIRETGGSAAWFGSYEGVSAAFRHYLPRKSVSSESLSGGLPGNDTLPFYQQMIAGACAGVAYNFTFYPADTIKSRMQTEEIAALTGPQSKTSFLTVGRTIWRLQGIKGLYRGCGITVFRAAPSSAFIFSIYESLRGWADRSV
ncbi:hypothetical protein FGG08_000845 [Glutinoglossum americanum]|uniref:Amino-acid transporter arg-13 n=1 Tax=Glutinoglossum americanum TaxID=1670608 RepID=A0A9P8I853_9PEZI|nr:hypothetical protein FGG08_000845 [Glutinoglossum americanum]